ncbi:MAG: FeoB-associated Cys-rich membrane protein [Schwartzia succinivorans]|nr:FeoB-associated Cys-rich membrane protein [Schwartzia succinivorans]
MATFVCAVLVAAALFFALRHIYRNFIKGESDCCGTSGCSCGDSCGGCSSCHPRK